MTQKRKTIIKQGAVADVMSHLSKLPAREKDPDMPVGLSELFRTKEYAAEIRAALDKGYTFDDLASIFAEKSGVKITGRQLKYHHTHEKNLKAKGKKSKSKGASKKTASPADTQQVAAECDEESASPVADTVTDSPLESSALASDHRLRSS